MSNSDSESGLGFNLLMPAALLVVLLIVPFSINGLMHMLAAKRQVTPLIMKMPVDSTTITIPPSVRQYESFDVTLKLDTKQLAKFLNEIIATASEGTAIQGISGVVSPQMKAEISGGSFEIDRQGPQDQISAYQDTAHWRWRVTPESSGTQVLRFQLQLLTQDGVRQDTRVLDLAEANFSVQTNLLEWFKHNGFWIALLLLAAGVFVRIWLKRRHA